VTQVFKAAVCLRKASAAFGSSQKDGSWLFFSFSSNSARFPAMSKTPPQRFHTLMQSFYLFGCRGHRLSILKVSQRFDKNKEFRFVLQKIMLIFARL
jgi:hypothetical protein